MFANWLPREFLPPECNTPLYALTNPCTPYFASSIFLGLILPSPQGYLLLALLLNLYLVWICCSAITICMPYFPAHICQQICWCNNKWIALNVLCCGGRQTYGVIVYTQRGNKQKKGWGAVMAAMKSTTPTRANKNPLQRECTCARD